MPKANDDYDPPRHKEIEASDRSWFIAPPYGWHHPITGRRGWQPDRLLLAFGQYVKRARYLAGISQVELAKQSGVDQGALSRLERALAPAMKVERLVKLSDTLGQFLPLGYCPHEHWCQWQRAPERAPDPPRRLTWEEFQIANGLVPPSGKPAEPSDPDEDEDFFGLRDLKNP